MNIIIKNTLSLTIITVALGACLGAVHAITLKPIEHQEQLAKEKAYSEVFADADSFENIDLKQDGWNDKITDALIEEGYVQETIDEAARAVSADGEELGYVLTVTTSEGYGGDIRFTLGVTDEYEMQGISFLSISETAGLGMRADTDEFRGQFKGRTSEHITYSKTGAASEDEIDALSAATITTNAVTNGVNAGLCALNIIMEGGAES